MTAWLQLSSGRGPAECRLAVEGIATAMLGILSPSTLLDTVGEGNGPGWESAMLLVDQEQAREWVGTLEWSCRSPLRPGHKRKRWFVGCTLLEQPEPGHATVRDDELEWETMRASGPGGQHVNKTESAVRLRHRPSGIVVVAREERSQHRNRALARARLLEALSMGERQGKADRSRSMWEAHDRLERGNPVKRFEGPDFRLLT